MPDDSQWERVQAGAFYEALAAQVQDGYFDSEDDA